MRKLKVRQTASCAGGSMRRSQVSDTDHLAPRPPLIRSLPQPQQVPFSATDTGVEAQGGPGAVRRQQFLQTQREKALLCLSWTAPLQPWVPPCRTLPYTQTHKACWWGKAPRSAVCQSQPPPALHGESVSGASFRHLAQSVSPTLGRAYFLFF